MSVQLYRACKRGNIACVKKLYCTNSFDMYETTNALNICCETGDLNLIKYLHTHAYYKDDVIQHAAKYNQFDIISYIIEIYEEEEYCMAFNFSCKYGHLDLAKKIFEHYSLTAINIRHGNNYAFRHACENGHIDVVKYLVESLNYTLHDTYENGNYAFRLACENGHIKVVKYLVEVLGVKDISIYNDYAFRVACTNGHIEVVKYLIESLHLSYDDITCQNNSPIFSACAHGHTEVVKYLCDIGANFTVVELKTICLHGHKDLILYICQRYNLYEYEMSFDASCII